MVGGGSSEIGTINITSLNTEIDPDWHYVILVYLDLVLQFIVKFTVYNQL